MKYPYIILILIIYSCGNSSSETSNTAEVETADEIIKITYEQFNSANMVLGKLNQQDFNEAINLTGSIDVPPKSRSSISSFMPGYVTNAPLLIGDQVKKGQLLVTLENPEFIELQQNYLEISENLKYLKSEYERQITLYEEKITSQKNYLKAESNYKSNLAHHNGLKEKLLMLNINPDLVDAGKISSTINLYSPISGYITKININNGSYVSASTEVIEVVNTEHIHLELDVFEKDILKIHKNQPIVFKTPEASNDSYKASVSLIGTSIDDINRTIKVHGHFEEENVSSKFLRGMFVEAKIITSTNKGLALPAQAVGEIDAKNFVLELIKKDDDQYEFRRTEVETGNRTEEWVEILNSESLRNKEVLLNSAKLLL